MNTTVLVFALMCPNESIWYSKELYYSAERCKQAAYGTALNLYMAHGKKCEYKCVTPDYSPQEAK